MALAIVVLAALALRLLCWVGPGARDDAQYMAYALDWVRGDYRFLHVDSVFAARPAVYAPVALTARVLPETWPAGAVLYFLMMSLAHVAAVGGIAWRLGGREAICAALLVAVLPLDVVFATQVMPDLPMAAWMAVGVWLLTLRPQCVTQVLAGVAFGLAAVTKEFAVVVLVLVPVLLPREHGRRGWLRAAGMVGFGGALPFAIELAWFSAHGDPRAVLAAIFHNARAEKNGNPDVHYLFRVLFETLPAGIGTRWFGGLAWAWLVSLAPLAAARRTTAGATSIRSREALFFVTWALAYFVFVQYVGPALAGRTTVERMERFLLPLAAPLALGVAVAFGALSRSPVAVVRSAAWAGVAVLVLLMLRATVVFAFPHEVQLSSDWRTIARHFERAGIRSALMDRDAAFRVTVFTAGQVVGRVWPEHRPLVEVPPAEWFVASANLTDHHRRQGEPIPPSWQAVTQLPGPILGPLGTFDPVVYWTGPGAPTPPVASRPEDPAGWTRRDRLDIGDTVDEVRHDYAITGGTWQGRRSLGLQIGAGWWYALRGVTLDDHGRAFTGHQQFVVRGLTPGRVLRVVKRVDGNVSHQVSRLLVNGRDAGQFRSGPGVPRWLEISVDVPAGLVTAEAVTLREEFLSSGGDVNAFQVRVYQREKP